MKKYKRGLVALSADPITFGHMDLIAMAREECETVLVLIANNDLKNNSYLFSLEERTGMARRAISESGLTCVDIIGSEGLLVDVYLREGCDSVFRGIRNENDRRYEEEQMGLHEYILPGLYERIRFTEAKDDHKLLSSSLVKSLVSHGIDVSAFVPLFVKQILEERMLSQWKVGVTGTMASGKTVLSKGLVRYFQDVLRIPAYYVGIDDLQRELYDEASLGAASVRNVLGEVFGEAVLSEDGSCVSRDVLKQKLFHPDCTAEIRSRLHEIVAPHIERKYREKLSRKQGLVVFEWSQIAEMSMSSWTNGNVVVVAAENQEKMLESRRIDTDQYGVIKSQQLDARQKSEILCRQAIGNRHGCVIDYTNRWSQDGISQGSLESLARHILTMFPDMPVLCRNYGDECCGACQ